MNPADAQRAIERLKKLHLLGFKKAEQHGILEMEFSVKLTALDFEELHALMEVALSDMPDVHDLKRDMGQTWARAEMLQNDLLGIYTGMLKNYNASQMGLREHDDGTPVIGVRPTEIVSVADKIMKIDQERVISRINSHKMLQLSDPNSRNTTLPPASSPMTLMAGLADEGDDPDDRD